MNAGYAQLEATLTDTLRATVGVRYEDATQSVLPIGNNLVGTNLSNGYWLPAATVTWTFLPDMQLRLHG